MKSKLWWFTSAALLCVGIWFVGLVAMAFASIEYLFGAKDAGDVVARGAEAMMLSSLGLAFAALLGTVLFLGRLRVRRVSFDLGVQSCAIMFGCLFTWTLVGDPRWLLAWAPLYALMFVKPFVLETRADDPAWKRFGLVGITAASAAFPLIVGLL